MDKNIDLTSVWDNWKPGQCTGMKKAIKGDMTMNRIGKILLLGMAVVIGLFFSGCSTGKEISKLTDVSYQYIHSSAVNSDCYYSVKILKGKYIAKIRPVGVPEEKALEVEVDGAVMRELEALFRKYDVGQWDGFQKSDSRIMDGRRFSLYLKMENGESVQASGYMEWPQNFRDVSKGLDTIFTRIYQRNRLESR